MGLSTFLSGRFDLIVALLDSLTHSLTHCATQPSLFLILLLTPYPPPPPVLRIVEPYDGPGNLAAAAENDSYSFSTWSGPVNAAIVLAFGVAFRIAAYVALKSSAKLKFS